MHRVWTVLTHDLAKAGPFIIATHQALLPLMSWKMGSNTVICFMSCALLGPNDSLQTHTQTHKYPFAHTKTNAHTHTPRCAHISMQRMDECASLQDFNSF